MKQYNTAAGLKHHIIIDLDGTLCDISHRVHLAQAKDWEEFHKGIPDDAVNQDVMQLLEIFSEASINIIICTGRPESTRISTLSWLHRNSVHEDVDILLMRPNDDHSPDHELKVRMLDEHFGSRESALRNILFILDDRDKVVEAYRNAGFACWQVQAGKY